MLHTSMLSSRVCRKLFESRPTGIASGHAGSKTKALLAMNQQQGTQVGKRRKQLPEALHLHHSAFRQEHVSRSAFTACRRDLHCRQTLSSSTGLFGRLAKFLIAPVDGTCEADAAADYLTGMLLKSESLVRTPKHTDPLITQLLGLHFNGAEAWAPPDSFRPLLFFVTPYGANTC